jgi:two-component system, OmpR family, response regulator
MKPNRNLVRCGVGYILSMPSTVDPSLARALNPQRGVVVAPAAAMGELSVAAMGNGREGLVLVTDAAAFASAASSPFDFVVVDAALRAEDAHEVIRVARDAEPRALVIVVTSAFEGCAAWLSAGADLALPHPLTAAALDAAFAAQARRARALLVPMMARVAVPWQLRVVDATLVTPGGVAVSLSPAEVLLVEVLARHEGSPLSRADLARAAGMLEDGKRNVDAAMYRMRKRIEASTGELAPLRSVHGQGYVIAARLEVLRGA